MRHASTHSSSDIWKCARSKIVATTNDVVDDFNTVVLDANTYGYVLEVAYSADSGGLDESPLRHRRGFAFAPVSKLVKLCSPQQIF